MLVGYTIGPYRSPMGTRGETLNIRAAGDVAFSLWQLGVAIICPHLNTAHFSCTNVPDEVWLQGDLELLSRSDFAVVLPGWEDSEGSKAEIRFAEEHGIPLFYHERDAERWRLLDFIQSHEQEVQ